jgi:hypothetical protein
MMVLFLLLFASTHVVMAAISARNLSEPLTAERDWRDVGTGSPDRTSARQSAQEISAAGLQARGQPTRAATVSRTLSRRRGGP